MVCDIHSVCIATVNSRCVVVKQAIELVRAGRLDCVGRPLEARWSMVQALSVSGCYTFAHLDKFAHLQHPSRCSDSSPLVRERRACRRR